MFGRFKPLKSTIAPINKDGVIAQPDPNVAPIDTATGVKVEASCNQTITITCLQELYNAVGVIPSARDNSIGITGYLVKISPEL